MVSENKILPQLDNTQSIVVVCKGRDYAKLMIGCYKEISKDFKKICLVALNKPFHDLIKDFQKEGLDCSNYYFVDCLSAKDTRLKESEQCLYVSSPSALTELALAIEKIRKTYQIDLMILDNISSLLIYNEEVTTLRFLHSTMTKLRQTNTKSVYCILQKDMKGPMEDLSLFADAVIELS